MRHGSHLDPHNRFESLSREADFEHVEWDQEYQQGLTNRAVEFIPDHSQSLVVQNQSPDIPFNYSLNPYRGCEHGCAYCYARPTHEYLGYNAGLDFETKIFVKEKAPQLLRQFLERPAWKPEPINFSGVTDCYQPAERKYRLTRKCLEVAAEFQQPISIVTKNALVVRDLDLLTRLTAEGLVHVYLSLTTLDAKLAREMEPRTSTPEARLRAIQELAEARIPVGVMTSPIIPGLNDFEIPQLLASAAQAGAKTARYILLRLPLTVEPVFLEWLQRTQPDRLEKVVSQIRATRSGKLSSSEFKVRMVGEGELADQVKELFAVFCRKHGLDGSLPPHNCSAFQVPLPREGQLRLF
jgi:DNA repair photolyase